MYFDSYWTSSKVILSRPTRSTETIFQEKSFPDEKHFWPFFTRITEYGRPQVIFSYAPQGIMAIDVQVIRLVL